MKGIFLFFLICYGLTMQASAQLVQGTLKVKEQSKVELVVKNGNAVNLYADFRADKYPILFSFSCVDVPLNDEKKEVVQFVFTTTVKRDGKVVGTAKRSPIPFFPGDMLMPTETFDFISVLSNLQTNAPDHTSEIPKGSYEITIEANAVGVKGRIQPATLLVKF